MKLVQRLLAHADALHFEALPPAVVQAAVTFITDSVAVALAGSRHPRVAEVRAAAAGWGQGAGARAWIDGTRWPAPTAAMLNAYQLHNQEFDCVHERAVVHPMATILPALLAVAEREGAAGRTVSGPQLIAAVVLAVDVATTIGSAQAAPMRFFRPAMCGALGASLGAAWLVGCTPAQRADVFGIAYSQLAGTMQAHTEGSPMLALQVGLAARAAVMALDLGRAGFAGPHDVIEGPFGYFELFDAPLAPRRDAVEAVFDELGRAWRITEVSHKPFPTGRAAQGALDVLATLMARHGFGATEVERIELAAPPLVLRLVGRPIKPDMDVNYARLCLPYLAATMLLKGSVTLDDFTPEALRDPARHALAPRVAWAPNAITDPNALVPQRLTVELSGSAHHATDLPAVLGHPQRPLSAAAQRAKFDACCRFAGLSMDRTDALHSACQQLPHLTDLRGFALLQP